MSFDCDVTVLGAGPYGLAAAAHLQRVKNLEVRAFGEPMSFWSNQMPAGMLLRSSWEASHLWDPNNKFSLNAYQIASGNHLSAPVSLERFVSYGLWFQQHAVPGLDRRKIARIEPDASGFRISLEVGETFKSRRVVVAAGISPFAWRPPEFNDLPSEMVSHSSEHRDLGKFSGKEVLVVGGGQSALESAALLHERGANVEVIVRRTGLKWLGWKKRIQSLGPISKVFYSWTDVGPAAISQIVSLPSVLQQFPRDLQDRLRKRSIRPAGAFWLLSRLKDVPLTTGRKVLSASPRGERLRVVLDDRSERMVDHVLLGTGYRIDVSRYSFLSEEIMQKVRRTEGFPQLGVAFESSVPGLHFLGAPAAWSYGPLMYFVAGTKYAARTLMSHLSSNRAHA